MVMQIPQCIFYDNKHGDSPQVTKLNTTPEDPYKLKKKSNRDLHRWIAGHQPGTEEHTEGILELMRRNEAPVRKREMIAIAIAVISIAVAIFVIVISYP
jgi:hypothetical protein